MGLKNTKKLKGFFLILTGSGWAGGSQGHLSVNVAEGLGHVAVELDRDWGRRGHNGWVRQGSGGLGALGGVALLADATLAVASLGSVP